MRLQRLLAIAGVASRRKAEELITAGRVTVNGKRTTELGAKADPNRDRIELDGKVLASEPKLTIIMNKPRGIVCTANDPEGRQTVLDLLKDSKLRLYPVGRLDFNTSGALLLTNDGELSYALTHPRYGVEKVYEAKIRGLVSEEMLARWRKGIELEDGVTAPAEVCRLEVEEGYTWLQVTLREGRNRQIRRMAEATGLEIIKLKRSSFAGIGIEGLRPGQYRPLTEEEMVRLVRDQVPDSLKARVRQQRSFVASHRDRAKKGWGKTSPKAEAGSEKTTTEPKEPTRRPRRGRDEETMPTSSKPSTRPKSKTKSKPARPSQAPPRDAQPAARRKPSDKARPTSRAKPGSGARRGPKKR
ncbi:MAG: pseudouridine synthase [Myxococcota bacterium]|jgi:23S rRNA pseudouridine2605 synthase|nr:pseudouridine synthase [Myxococcota bacterium]